MSKNVKMTNPMKVITGPNTRWSYANVWEPKSINGGTPKYSVSLIIPKSDTKTVAKIEAAIEAAYKEGEAKLKGNGKSVPALSVLKTPIYNMLMDYKGNVTVKIDGIAASAASVIAMAGTKIMVSPVSMLMIHNPATMAFGDSAEMQKAIAMLEEVKESIINAYEIKTGLSRAKLSHLMDAETWMNANMAIELGFADEIMKRDTQDEADIAQPAASASFSRAAVTNSLIEKLATKCHIPAKPTEPTISERSVDSLMERLNLIKQHI